MISQTPSFNFRHLKKRALILQSIRAFFISNNFLEVETPLRCPSIIPEAHIDPVLSEGQFLQASPEMCMKRLLAGGKIDKIFQICKCFRKNERGCFHLPELTLLEWYRKKATYLNLMKDCEKLICAIADVFGLNGHLSFQGNRIRLLTPWKMLSVAQAFVKYASISLEQALADDRFDEIISFEIEPCLGFKKPVFLYDYPSSQGSLAKLHPQNKGFVQRFELYIAGVELANAFTELTDPMEQRKRFQSEIASREKNNATALPIPEKFLEDLNYLEETAGIALGLDRLVMLFCDAAQIDDVVAFTPESL